MQKVIRGLQCESLEEKLKDVDMFTLRSEDVEYNKQFTQEKMCFFFVTERRTQNNGFHLKETDTSSMLENKKILTIRTF